MPSIPVTPEVTNEQPVDSSTGAGPVIGGFAFRRPNGRSEPVEALRGVVELSGGSTRSYDRGIRRSWSFSWSRMTEGEVTTLRDVCRVPYVTLEREAGEVPVVVSTEDGISAEAVPGTYPVRYAVSVNLKARDPIR